MPEAEITRLTIVWSKDTDLALRSHLGAQGLKKAKASEKSVARLRQPLGSLFSGVK
jgi:hypothetical protein